MAQFMIMANYTTEGLRGLMRDGPHGRRQAIGAAVEALGGRLHSIHWALGDHDVYVICDMPDTISAAALSMNVALSGAVRTRTVTLLGDDDLGKAIAKGVTYRAPGG